MADGLSIGSLSVSGGLTRLTGTSSKLDTEAIVAAAYEAKRLPAVRLEQRISRNEARGAALGELKTPAAESQGRRRGPAQPAGPAWRANENVFETKQVFLSGGGAVPAGGAGRRQRRESCGGRRLLARGRPPGHRPQARGPTARCRRPDAGRRLERRCRLRRARSRSALPAASRLRSPSTAPCPPTICAPRSTPSRRRPASRPASCRSRPPIGAWC